MPHRSADSHRSEAKLAYRPDVDGLRGIAVLGVILFHAEPSWLPGGYVGVDIFFVISGYLITRIVAGELQAGQFRAARFFERRIRRLLPALLLVLAACLLPAWYGLLPQQLTDFAGSLWAVSGLVANLFFWRQTGYFTAGAEQHPLIHTWSLSVEEQFYLLFVLVFPLCWRRARRHLPVLLLLTGGLSLLACDLASRLAPALGFYALPFRAWELLAGASLGLAAATHSPRLEAWQRRAGPASGWLGLALIAAALLGFDAETPFPSAWTLLPVVGSLLLLAQPASAAAGTIGLLGWRPLVAAGLVSYSAYLWHQPLFTFARLASAEPLGPLALAGLVALTLVLAASSWRWVEQPLRDRARSRGTRLAVVVLGGLVLVNGAAWWLRSQDGAPDRLNAEARHWLVQAADKNPRQMACLARPEHPIAPADACVIGTPGVEPTVAVLGDSHADALFVALTQRLREAGLAARFLAHAGCPPVPGLWRSDTGSRSPCDQHQRSVRAHLADHPALDTVLVVARWAAYLDGRAYDNGEGGRTGGVNLRVEPMADWRWWWRSAPDAHRAEVASLTTAGLQTLLDGRRRVALVYPIPEVGWVVPEHLARRAWRGHAPGSAPVGDLSTSYARYLDRNRLAMAALDGVKADGAKDEQLLRIRPDALFCNRALPNRCMAQRGGEALYYDDNHLNSVGAGLLIEQVATALDWGRRPP